MKNRGASTKAPEQQAILKHSAAQRSDAKADEQLQAAELMAARALQLEAKEAQLLALSSELDAAEGALLRAQLPAGSGARTPAAAAAAAEPGLLGAMLAPGLADATAGEQDGPGSCLLADRWRCLSARRSELAARWQCLLEERRQLSIMLQQRRGHKGGGGGGDGGDGFEPGQTPLRDVTCAVVTHQLDVPFFSCCFQR